MPRAIKVGGEPRDIFNVQLAPYQRALLDRAAEHLRLSKSEVLRRALEKYVAALIALDHAEHEAA